MCLVFTCFTAAGNLSDAGILRLLSASVSEVDFSGKITLDCFVSTDFDAVGRIMSLGSDGGKELMFFIRQIKEKKTRKKKAKKKRRMKFRQG